MLTLKYDTKGKAVDANTYQPPGFHVMSVSCMICGIREYNMPKFLEFLGKHGPHLEAYTRNWPVDGPVKIIRPGDETGVGGGA